MIFDAQVLLTFSVLALYVSLFLYIYVQLIRVLAFGHKKWCYRTAVLFSCIVWTSLRITLFSYYWAMKHNSEAQEFPEISKHVDVVTYFLLFSFPLYLQFLGLSLLVAYFSKILSISEDIYQISRFCSLKKRKMFIIICNIFVLVINFICAVAIKQQKDIDLDVINRLSHITFYVIYCRVLLNATAFILFSVFLALLIHKVSKTEEARMLLETENISPQGAIYVGSCLCFLYTLRTTANILALIPSIKWVYDTDQFDLLSNHRPAYYMFVVVLIFWEFFPTLATVVFFRVKRPQALLVEYEEEVSLEEDGIHNTGFDSCSITFNREPETSRLISPYLNGANIFASPDASPSIRQTLTDRIYC